MNFLRKTWRADMSRRTSRSFVEKYLRLSALSGPLRLSWVVPGLIQPLHAIIILLMHLSGCSHPDTESQTRDLVDQTINLRSTWILSGTVHPMGAMRWDGRLPYLNPRYCILKTLRKRVGQELRWALPESDTFLGGAREDGTLLATENEMSQVTASECVQQRNTGEEDSALDAALDNFLTGDPMDLLQWDEWEDTATGIFIS